MSAHLDEVRVDLGVFFQVRRVELQGGQVLLNGTPESLRDDWEKWAGERPKEVGGGPHLPVEATGISVSWAESAPSTSAGELQGLSALRDNAGTRVSATGGHARLGRSQIEFTEAAAEMDARGKLVRAHARALTVGWTDATQTEHAAASSAANELPPPPAPAVIARAARAGKRARSSPPPPADAGAPLVALPDLHTFRGRAAAAASLLAERVLPDADIGVDAMTWRLSQGPNSVALTFGPGPLSLTNSARGLELGYSTHNAAASAPLALRIMLPTDRSDVVLTVEGGPVSFSLLGVQEGGGGLVDVDRATVAGRARVALAGDGSTLTFDADAGTHGLSLNHPKLALETIRGLDIALRARGVITDAGEMRLDDFGVTLGALHIAGGGVLEQKPDYVTGSARFEVSASTCQALLDSVPAALLPALQGTKMSGTFGASGRFAFDTRSLDDLELKYDIQDRCHIVLVPPALEHDRFMQPFAHRIYLPDGTTAEETTGPGTPGWTPLEQISPYMQTAVLTTEDGAFPKHRGFNHAAIRASILANLKARRFVRGASTITMQLAKNLFLSRDKTVSRKLEEVVLTDYLEQQFSKEEILELYLNVIEFGPAVYGIASAAEYYFGRAPSELDLAECLFLSSLLPAPLRYSGMRQRDQVPDSWMKTLYMLMEVAHKRGLLTDAELADGENEEVLFWHGGARPEPRAAVRPRGPILGGVGEIPDPFEGGP
jgi:Transglycosylase